MVDAGRHTCARAYGTQAPGLTPIEVSFELPASVAQGWVDVPASNAGLILRVLSDNTHYHFVAREEPVATDHRPQLVVELE